MQDVHPSEPPNFQGCSSGEEEGQMHLAAVLTDSSLLRRHCSNNFQDPLNNRKSVPDPTPGLGLLTAYPSQFVKAGASLAMADVYVEL